MTSTRTTACLAGVLITALTAVAAAAEPSSQPAGAAPATLAKNPQLVNLEPNKWFKLHEQKPADEPQLDRLSGFATCYDSRRGRIIMMGSNFPSKEGALPSNSPFFFDVATATWSRAYPDDVYETYKVNEKGVFVAGENGDRPWGGTISCNSLVYDSERDELVHGLGLGDSHADLVSRPFSKKDAKVTSNSVWNIRGATFKGVEFRTQKEPQNQPLWVMNLERKQWSMLDAQFPPGGPVGFLSPAVYDPVRKKIVIYDCSVIEIGGERDKVERLHPKTPGWCAAAAYDAKNQAYVGYGKGCPEASVYYCSGKEPPKQMPTPGPRPPKVGSTCAMAYDSVVGKTVLCVPDNPSWDKNAVVETWLYDLAADAWKRIPDADLSNVETAGWGYYSPKCSLVYDENHKVCFLVGRQLNGPLTIWALKIDASKLR